MSNAYLLNITKYNFNNKTIYNYLNSFQMTPSEKTRPTKLDMLARITELNLYICIGWHNKGLIGQDLIGQEFLSCCTRYLGLNSEFYHLDQKSQSQDHQ